VSLENINKLIFLFMVLEQKHLLDSYYLSLQGTDLKYRKSNFYTYSERSIPLDTLNLRGYFINRQIDISTLVIGGCTFLAGFLGVILITQGLPKHESFDITLGSLFLFAALVGVAYGLNQIRVRVHIHSNIGATVSFFHNKPTKQLVDEFIQNLKDEQKKLFLNRFGTYDNLLPLPDQINNLTWLRNNNFLSHEEYEEKRKSFMRGNDKKIGY
jgi:hypothetical protein